MVRCARIGIAHIRQQFTLCTFLKDIENVLYTVYRYMIYLTYTAIPVLIGEKKLNNNILYIPARNMRYADRHLLYIHAACVCVCV